MAAKSPSFPLSGRRAAILFSIGFFWITWKFSSLLRRRIQKRRLQDDWSASLWTSPILRNPESYFYIGSLSFLAGGLSDLAITLGQRKSLGEPEFMLMFGGGMLAGWTIFRLNKKKWANQALVLAPAPVIGVAGQPPHQ